MRSGTFKQSYAELVALSDNPAKWAWCGAALVAALALPLVANSYALGLATTIAITAIAVLGLNLLTGVAGQLSLGHAGFLALGAYTQAILGTDHGWPALPALAAAGAVAALSSLAVGIPSLRLKGLYLALTTLGFSVIVTYLLVMFEGITRGPSGMPVPALAPLVPALDHGRSVYLLALLLLIAFVLATLNLMRSKIGRAWAALHEHDIAASAMGINLTAYKLLAFVVSAFYAGVAGGLLAVQTRYVNVDTFGVLLSVEALAMVIVGGIGRVTGALLGTAFLIGLPELIRLAFGGTGSRLDALFANHAHEVKELLYGAAILLFLRLEPEGLAGIWRKVKRFWVLWPLSK